MFSLLSGLLHYLFSRDEYYALILGLDNAGKTTLVEKAKHLFKPEYNGIALDKITPTVGLNDVGRIRFICWDLGGQRDLHTLWDKYYAEAHAVIYVIDSTARDRLRESKAVFDRVIDSKKLKGLPLLVVANKQDVEGAMSVPEIKEVFNESAHKIGVRDCKVYSVSAISGRNLKEGLEWLAASVQRNPSRPPIEKEYG